MKKNLLLLLVTLTAMAVYGQQEPSKGARIEFRSTTVDYGEVMKGSDGYRTVEFVNTGDAPLVITRVQSSCGCTVAEKPDKPIMPGEKGRIKIHYNTNHVGTFRKTVTLYTNAVNVPNGRVVLKVKGKVIDPNQVDLNRKKEARGQSGF